VKFCAELLVAALQRMDMGKFGLAEWVDRAGLGALALTAEYLGAEILVSLL
jgi:hypothetical protein